ncbi:MAG: HD domain-containing protein [Elusimicrobiota bacterium]
MLSEKIIKHFFSAASMHRWNDKMRPVDLIELDKQAHKMMIAYILGKYEEINKTPGFSWIEIIEGGFFEFMQRTVITDLRPQLLYKIKNNKQQYAELKKYILARVKDILSGLKNDYLLERFKKYLANDKINVNTKILEAAHLWATRWEFDIIKNANPNGYEISEIGAKLNERQEKNLDLISMKNLILSKDMQSFINLCGELRFQVRWSHIPRIPATSVLGHMLIVALFSFIFTIEMDGCDRRIINNYFTGLFHDLPEVLTRDVISPIKKGVKGLDLFIKKFEKEEMEDKIYRIIPNEWKIDMKMFTEDEFSNIVTVNNKKKRIDNSLFKKYNYDKYNPRDGKMIEFSDKLAAYMEAYLAIENGANGDELKNAMIDIKKKYNNTKISGYDLGSCYNFVKNEGRL